MLQSSEDGFLFTLIVLMLLAGWVHRIQCTHYLTEPSYPGRIKINCLRKVWSLLPQALVGVEGVAAASGRKGGFPPSLAVWCLHSQPSRMFSFCR